MPVIAGISAVGKIAEIYGGSVGVWKPLSRYGPEPPSFWSHLGIPTIPWEIFSEGSLWGFSGNSRTRGRLPPAHAVLPLPYEYPVSIFCSLQDRLWDMKTAHAGISPSRMGIQSLLSVFVKIGYGLCSQDRLWAPKIGRNFCRRNPPISAKIPPPFRPKYPLHFGQNTPPISPYLHLHFCPTLVAHFHRSKRNSIFFNIFLLY